MQGRILLGRYEIVRLLGEGGMGRVWLARQLDLGRQVVIKVMHEHIAADPAFRERFQRETLLLARFQHPYVVTLYDASWNDPQGPCIVMEYVRGVPLDLLLQRNGRLSPPRVGRLLGQLCEALQAAHQEGIIHRDLKPANLMVVDADTPYEKIKVMDFGLAKAIRGPARQGKSATTTGVDFAVGTPGYISPEQVRGDPLDHRSDLYSVGVLLYELLAGRLPFTGADTMEILLAHATEEPPTFAELGVDWVPPAIEAVVRRCLAKDPAERPQSAQELAELYEAALTAELTAAPPAAAAWGGTASLPTSANPASAPPATPPRPPLPAPATEDPTAVVRHLEAWMPEKVAVFKLRGFIEDVGGQVVANEPGRIRVRLGGRGSSYQLPSQGPLSWLLGRRPIIDMELLLQRHPNSAQSTLLITVILRSPDTAVTSSSIWRARCEEIFCDLRGYLMGSGIQPPTS
jgi:serine/threonine protein kinase